MVGLVGLDIHIRPCLPDEVNRDGFFLRVIHGNEVRVRSVHHLFAGAAGQAGLALLPLAQNCCRQELCQGMLSAPCRAGDKIEMGDMPRCQTPAQILFQLFVAKKSVKGHNGVS